MAKEIMDEAYACPMCIRDILSTLGISKMFLLKIQDPIQKSIKVNGSSFQVGELFPFYDDLDEALLGFNGINSCGHTVGISAISSLIPKYYLPT